MPLAIVGIALVFSDVPWLAPVLLLLAALIVLLDSWLHRPGRLIDPRVAKEALRRAKEAERDGSEIRPRARSTTNGPRQPNRQPQPNRRQQPPRQRPAAPYREPQRGRSRY